MSVRVCEGIIAEREIKSVYSTLDSAQELRRAVHHQYKTGTGTSS